jgi:hypothetical protein
MNKVIKILVIAILALAVVPSCGVLEQTAQMQRLSLCTFDVTGVDNIKLAGVNLRQGMSYSDLNAAQVMSLTGALFSRNLPLEFIMNIKVDNPNDNLAAMNRMEYIILLDGLQLVTGAVNERYEVPAGGSTTIPMKLQLELFEALSGETGDALVNLAFKLTGNESNPSELLFRVKPFIRVGGRELAYPGYLNVGHTLN